MARRNGASCPRMPLLAAALIAGAAHAGGDDLLRQINELRASPARCDGRQPPPADPLAADAKLARVQVEPGASIHDAVREAGYLASAVKVIHLSGPPDAYAAIAVLEQHYCGAMLDPKYTAIGVSQDQRSWQLVLAQPLLSRDLGDWEEAGLEVLARVNDVRAEARQCGSRSFDAAPALDWNPHLAAAALAHSRDMARRDRFTHRGADGEATSDRVEREGYRWQRVGENIAAGVRSAQQAVSGWVASPRHCANLMNPAFTEMGAAYAVDHDSSSGIYWTQVFATPR
jgi:hypothetical protein